MPSKWDGKSRPVNNAYRKNYNDIFKKKDKTVKEASIRAFFNSCLSPEEQKKRKKNV